MRQQTTLADLERIIGKINTDRGLTPSDIGSVRLYRAYGSFAIHELASSSGSIHDLTGLGTKRETYEHGIRLRFSKPISR